MKSQKPVSLWCWLGMAAIFAGLTALFLSPGTLRAANAPSEWRERTIRRLPIERNEPIAIVKVKVKGKSVFRSRKFLSDDDWLNGLTITVKNRSGKEILFASIQLQFPRPLGSEGRIALDDMHYGNYALLSRAPSAEDRAAGIAPGETAEIALSAHEVDAIKLILNGTAYPSSIEKVDLRIASVIFEDDTMWEGGSRLQRDQNNPRSWVNVELSSSATDGSPTGSSQRKSPLRISTAAESRPNQPGRAADWFRYVSLPPTKQLFSRASYHSASPPQNSCYQLGGAANYNCGVVGRSCMYRKASVTSQFGGYYLADCSALCKDMYGDTCGGNWHDSKVENSCGSTGGGGGGGGSEGGGCWSDWDCGAGEECSGGNCQEYGGGYGGLEP